MYTRVPLCCLLFAVCAASQSAFGGELREVKGHLRAGVNNIFKRLGGREGSLRGSLPDSFDEC